jgi:hypothetical protein
MEFTIFYAWQSDRPQNTHRYLIRDAVKEAMKRIGRDADLEDSPRLDHDTKDVPGTPEIAGTIFRKIQESGAFIADLTFIGATDQHDGEKKLLPNPNMLLELGYAARSIGWDRIICVMNDAYGPPEKQIFDIKQRRWPICYRLKGENPEDIHKVSKFLSGQLQNAIRTVMDSSHEAVEDAISRLTPQALQFIERHRNFIYFWTPDRDVGRVGALGTAAAMACLLDLKLIRAFFGPTPDVNRYVYTWTYIGKLVKTKMEPHFPPIPPRDVKEEIEVAPAIPENQSSLPADPGPNSLSLPTPDDTVRPRGGSLRTRMYDLWAWRIRRLPSERTEGASR